MSHIILMQTSFFLSYLEVFQMIVRCHVLRIARASCVRLRSTAPRWLSPKCSTTIGFILSFSRKCQAVMLVLFNHHKQCATETFWIDFCSLALVSSVEALLRL